MFYKRLPSKINPYFIYLITKSIIHRSEERCQHPELCYNPNTEMYSEECPTQITLSEI